MNSHPIQACGNRNIPTNINAQLGYASLIISLNNTVSVEKLLAGSCPAEIWFSYYKYLPEKQSFEGKYDVKFQPTVPQQKHLIVIFVHH